MMERSLYIFVTLLAFSATLFGQNPNHKNLNSAGGGGTGGDEDWLEVGSVLPSPNASDAYHVGRAVVGAVSFTDLPTLEVDGGMFSFITHADGSYSYLRQYDNNPIGISTFHGNAMRSRNAAATEILEVSTSMDIGGLPTIYTYYSNSTLQTNVFDRVFNTGMQRKAQDIINGETTTADQAFDNFRYTVTTPLGGSSFSLLDASSASMNFTMNGVDAGGVNAITVTGSSLFFTTGINTSRFFVDSGLDLHMDNYDEIFIDQDIQDDPTSQWLLTRDQASGEVRKMDVDDLMAPSGGGDPQDLTWTLATTTLSIDDGNSVDLSGLLPTAANVGGAVEVWQSPVTGVPPQNLNFRTLVAGPNVTLIQNANTIEIQATAGGGADGVLNSLTLGGGGGTILSAGLTIGGPITVDLAALLPLGNNLGAGEGIFTTVTGTPANTLNFKSLVAGTNVSLVADANTITINSTGGGGVDEFLDLLDTPGSYAGSGNYLVTVNVGETALEFTDPATVGYSSWFLKDVVNRMDAAHTHSIGTGDIVEVKNGLHTPAAGVSEDILWGGTLDRDTEIDHATGDHYVWFREDPRVMIGNSTLTWTEDGNGLLIGRNNIIEKSGGGAGLYYEGFAAGKDLTITSTANITTNGFVYGDNMTISNMERVIAFGESDFSAYSVTGGLNSEDAALILGGIEGTMDIDEGGIIDMASRSGDFRINLTLGTERLYQMASIMNENPKIYMDGPDGNYRTGVFSAMSRDIDIDVDASGTNYAKQIAAILSDGDLVHIGFNTQEQVGLFNTKDIIHNHATASSGGATNLVTYIGSEGNATAITNIDDAKVTFIGTDATTIEGVTGGSMTMIGTDNSAITSLGASNCAFIGGGGHIISITESNSVYVPNLMIDQGQISGGVYLGVGLTATPASSAAGQGDPGQVLIREYPVSSGCWYLYYKTHSGWVRSEMCLSAFP